MPTRKIKNNYLAVMEPIKKIELSRIFNSFFVACCVPFISGCAMMEGMTGDDQGSSEPYVGPANIDGFTYSGYSTSGNHYKFIFSHAHSGTSYSGPTAKVLFMPGKNSGAIRGVYHFRADSINNNGALVRSRFEGRRPNPVRANLSPDATILTVKWLDGATATLKNLDGTNYAVARQRMIASRKEADARELASFQRGFGLLRDLSNSPPPPDRDSSTRTMYRCKKCGETEYKTGKYQDLTPGGTCSGTFLLGHLWEKIGKFEID